MQIKYNNLAEFFEHIVQKFPERIALKDSNRQVTYKELLNNALQISKLLKKRNVLTGDRVICVSKKNVESLLCFWGIAFSGAIPVMLDHEDGIATNTQKINTVNAKIIICDKISPGLFGEANVIGFGELLSFEQLDGENFLDTATEFSEICYILLTSGTSGVPKAVQVTHHGVLHYINAIYKKIGSPESIKAGHVTTFAADLGMTNILVALISGGMLRVFNKDEVTDPAIFNNILLEDQIDFLKMTPSHLISLIGSNEGNYNQTVKYLILGGEKLSWSTVENIYELRFCEHLFNHYGPTETTIGATAYKVERGSKNGSQTGSVPIGMPLGENDCFLINKNGDVGELLISGPGVSLGYFKNVEETDKRFVEIARHGRVVKCYKTGDLCKEDADGNFEFLYRTDRQVKIRGYRIELGEIEQLLISHPNVESAIVSTSVKESQLVLDAYVRLKNEIPLNAGELKQWMGTKVPSYKIPGNIFFYDDPPYNSNGKIDLNALKSIFLNNTSSTQILAVKAVGESWSTDVEIIWKNILNMDSIAFDANFFEIGGDSLMAIQVIGRLQRYGYKVNITDLNKSPVFTNFLALNPIKETTNYQYSNFNKVGLTLSQADFIERRKNDLNKYCQSVLLESSTKISLREFAMAINCILKSHSQLTRNFFKDSLFDNEISEVGLKTTVIDETESIAQQIQKVMSELLKEISIENGRLFIAHIFIDPAGTEYILLMCHHLAVDVISWNIIFDELIEYYDQLINNIKPQISPENVVTDFYHKNPEKYFGNYSDKKSDQRLLKLLKDDAGESHQDVVRNYSFKLPVEVSDTLKHIDESKDKLTVSGYLLNAFVATVLELFELQEISVDTEFHGRPQVEQLPDLSRSVAWWATTVNLNLNVSDVSPEYCSDLVNVKANYANNINLLAGKKNNDIRLLPDIRFNYLGHFPEKFGNGSIVLKPSSFNPGPNRAGDAQKEYKLFFTSRFIGSQLIIDIQYQSSTFKAKKIEKFIKQFQLHLQESLKDKLPNDAIIYPFALESIIPSIGQPLFNLHASMPIKGKKNILLTGATGFLGAHILKELLNGADVKIYCIVRGLNYNHAKKRLENVFKQYHKMVPNEYYDRVVILNGNLVDDQFGLLTFEYENLSSQVDTIIHAAADINLMKDFDELSKVNIMSTSSLLAFAKERKPKEFHYVSTLAVSGYQKNKNFMQFSELDFDCGQLFVSSYEETKYESEKLVRQYFDGGGKGKIYRSGHIAAESVSAEFQSNIDQNRVFQIIKGIVLLKKVPYAYNEKLSFSHVDIVAKGVAGMCLNKIDSDMSCLHIESPHSLSFLTLVQMLNKMGYAIQTVEMNNFNSAVADFGGSQADKETVALASIWINRYINYPRKIKYLQHTTIDTIAKFGLYFPDTDYNWFNKMVNKGIIAGYFPDPLIEVKSDLQIENLAHDFK